MIPRHVQLLREGRQQVLLELEQAEEHARRDAFRWACAARENVGADSAREFRNRALRAVAAETLYRELGAMLRRELAPGSAFEERLAHSLASLTPNDEEVRAGA